MTLVAFRSSSSTFTKVSLNSINQELFLKRINLENNVIISLYGFSLGMNVPENNITIFVYGFNLGMNAHCKFLEYGNLIIKIMFPIQKSGRYRKEEWKIPIINIQRLLH